MRNKKIVLAVLGLTIMLGSAFLGAGYVSAQDIVKSPSIVQRIAKEFNLGEAEVQAVFDEERTARQVEMQKQVEARLSQAVKDGKITETQKQAILDKFQEMKANKPKNLEKFKDMTADVRRQTMASKKAELEAWAKQNDIDLATFHELIGPKGGMKFMRHRH